jgi:glutamate-ammonia-ligase adenylyltransferase
MRIVQLLQKVISRSCYVALLTENPSALKHLIQLCAASPWIAEYLAHQPALFDDLLSPQTLYAPLRREELKIDLENRMTDCPADDIERQMEVLRRFLHTHRLRVAAADIVGEFPVMKVSDCLTETAEVILQKTLLLAWQTLSEKHGQPVCQNNGSSFTPEFLVVAYGKLGGIELGYSSDLDLVFIHNSRGEHQETTGPKVIDNTEFFMRLGKKVIHYLTTRTPAGILYEIDMRLRPSGNSGLLVVDIDSFAQYQRENAWTWEHQAIIRARPIAGSEAIAASFEEIRSEMINRPRNTSALRQEIVEMRRKMDELDRSMPDLFDLKLGKGGITDIEFIVQYLVLRWSSETPGLIRYTDNIRLLEGLGESQRLDQQTASLLMDAYRAYRSRVHHLALQQEKPLIPQSDLNEYKQAVCRIWTTLFNTERAPG